MKEQFQNLMKSWKRKMRSERFDLVDNRLQITIYEHYYMACMVWFLIQRENIEKFILAGIDKLNCKKLDLFQVVDLYEKTNPGQVCVNIM